MEKIGKATKTIHAALESSSPDVAAIKKSAATIAELSAKSSGWFPPGTGPDVLARPALSPQSGRSRKTSLAKDRDFQQGR